MGQTDNSEAVPTLRPIRAVEIPALVELWVAAWQATMPAIDFDARRGWIARALADPAWRTLVIVTNGGPVGFASRQGTILQQIVVAVEAQGSGDARRLMRGVKAESPDGLDLEVNQDNQRAVAFYNREGFRQVGVGVNVGSGLATWTMRWP